MSKLRQNRRWTAGKIVIAAAATFWGSIFLLIAAYFGLAYWYANSESQLQVLIDDKNRGGKPLILTVPLDQVTINSPISKWWHCRSGKSYTAISFSVFVDPNDGFKWKKNGPGIPVSYDVLPTGGQGKGYRKLNFMNLPIQKKEHGLTLHAPDMHTQARYIFWGDVVGKKNVLISCPGHLRQYWCTADTFLMHNIRFRYRFRRPDLKYWKKFDQSMRHWLPSRVKVLKNR